MLYSLLHIVNLTVEYTYESLVGGKRLGSEGEEMDSVLPKKTQALR